MIEGGIPHVINFDPVVWGHDLEIVVADIKLTARFKCKFMI